MAGEMESKSNIELVAAMRQLVNASGVNMSAPDRADRILEEMERRAPTTLEALESGLRYAEACKDWPGSGEEQQHYEESVAKIRKEVELARGV